MIRFLTPERAGMLSLIVENRPNERLSIKHIGIVNQGIGETDSDAARAWALAYETYTLKEIDGDTELTVAMDVPPKYEEHSADTWPKVFEAIKTLAETSAS